MKRFSLILAVVAISFVACQTGPSTEVVGGGGGPVTLTVSISDTRTVLGDKGADGVYPLSWSEGDKIVVNGIESESANISESDARIASFTVQGSVGAPFNITYPYCESTTARAAKVYFSTEQNYVEGSFSEGSVPMCGYLAERSNKVELKHLSGLLRFPVKAGSEGAVLSKVVITSNNKKLSGEFNVNCQNATITARSSGSNQVIYNLPENFALSTSEEKVLYIALPAYDVGTCSLVFEDANGGNMERIWSGGTVKPGVVREFKTLTYERGSVANLESFEVEEDVIITGLVTGLVRDTNGNPIEGVAVSDGFTVVTTDGDGRYELNPSNDAWHIYITVPAEYEIPINPENNQPAFYQKYELNKYRYDFTLKPLAGGKEDKFALFVIGDPQVGSNAGRNRLRDEAIPAIKKHAQTTYSGVPCYGITLGDLISNNNSSDRSVHRPYVFDYFNAKDVGMPVFHVMGNHDNTYFNATNPLRIDRRTSTTELMAQRAHEDLCGPVNFSFNRGDMHIISMRNIVYNSDVHCEDYMRRAFLDEQCEWLKQDLALVPEDKAVILCVHIPFQSGGGSHVDYVRKLISEYKEVHIMSGHSHLIQHIKGAKAEYPDIYEHNMGALCGAWWTSYICGDGSPAGYGVFIAEGTTFTDWYHIGYSETAKNRSHQMRLYKGNAVTGANKASGDTGFYAFNFDKDVLLANVYMADSEWTIKVYEDGEYSGEMTNISVANGQLANVDHFRRPKIYRDEETTPSADGAGYGYMLGDGTDSNPYKSSVVTSGDIYFSGLTNGVLGFNDWAFGTNAQCYHMYMYKLKKGSFKNIKVEAIDKFGNVYTETKITEGTDYSTVAY